MRRESTLAFIMNFVVSGYVYFVAFMLVLFMVSSLVSGIFSLVSVIIDSMTSSGGLFEAAKEAPVEIGLLHTIAFTIVLVKAYKILVAYAQTQHINLKYLVEIAIIAPTIELIFNNNAYNFEVQILLSAFAFANLVAYLFFYNTLKQSRDDYIQEYCELQDSRRMHREKRRKFYDDDEDDDDEPKKEKKKPVKKAKEKKEDKKEEKKEDKKDKK